MDIRVLKSKSSIVDNAVHDTTLKGLTRQWYCETLLRATCQANVNFNPADLGPNSINRIVCLYGLLMLLLGTLSSY